MLIESAKSHSLHCEEPAATHIASRANSKIKSHFTAVEQPEYLPVNMPAPARPVARIRSENPVDLQTAASIFPRGEMFRSVSVRAVFRWIIGGKKGVKLEGIRIGSRWYTSVEAISRFCERVRIREESAG